MAFERGNRCGAAKRQRTFTFCERALNLNVVDLPA